MKETKGKELSIIAELENGSRMKEGGKHGKKNPKKPEPQWNIENIIKQKMQAKAHRIRRFEKRSKLHRHNKIFKDDAKKPYWRGSIVFRAYASRAEGLRFQPDSISWLNNRSLFTQQQIGTWWQHWEDKGGEERNWPLYLIWQWLSISVLSNRHSPTYESIRDYLYRFKRL